jgi:hypothetical protein
MIWTDKCKQKEEEKEEEVKKTRVEKIQTLIPSEFSAVIIKVSFYLKKQNWKL